MNTTSASPADRAAGAAPASTPPGAEAPARRILVWDAPVRVFHWLMVACFAGAWLTSESEAWRLVHVTLGYTMAGLVAFRIAWGFIGTRHARFADFVRSPRAVMDWVRAQRGPRPAHTVGHNPAGAWAILALLAATAAVALTGWLAFADVAGDAAEELHEAIATGMLVLVGVHVAGVLFGSWRERQNLVGAMVGGHKQGPASEGIPYARWGIAAVLLSSVIAFWGWQATQAPPAGADGATAAAGPGGGAAAGHDRDGDRDDD